MARKEYTAVSMEPDAAEGMRAIRRYLSAQLGADVSMSQAVLIAERIVVKSDSVKAAGRHLNIGVTR